MPIVPEALTRFFFARGDSRSVSRPPRTTGGASAMPSRVSGGRLAPRESSDTIEKSSRVGPLIAYDTLGQPVWSPRDYSAFAREGFMQNAIVYRSVRMIAEAAASIPLLLYEGDNEIEAHPLLELMRQPSLDHTGTDFLESWYGFLLVSGNAYVEAVAVDGVIRELHNLRPDRMNVIPGPDGWPEGYEYTAGGKSVRFGADVVDGVRPILHTRLFHPASDHYGMSPIEAAATAIDIHNTASAWNKALLDNSARPSGALVYAAANGQMTEEQYARLKSELESNFQGATQAGRPLLLEGGLDWKPLSLTPKDMDFIQAKNAAAREIALSIGVPPQLLGIPGDNTYSNYAEAQRAFWRQTVLPLVNRMAQGFSRWLGVHFALGDSPSSSRPPSAGALELRPDLDSVEALNPEREALWARLNAATFLTDDEKRAAAGYGEKGASSTKYREDQPRVPAGSGRESGQWTDDDGGGQPENGLEERVRLAQAPSSAENVVDLLEEENKLGGHTIARHVARPDEELLDNVRRDRYVGPFLKMARRAQGAFLSLEDANNFVNRTLDDNRSEVDAVANGLKSDAEFVKRFGFVTGKEAFRSDVDSLPFMRPTYAVYVRIQADRRSAKGYRIFSSYPINPRPANE